MDHAEMVALIRAGVPNQAGAWADLGAGTGNFTWALAELLGPTAAITAIDRDTRAVAALEQRAQRDTDALIVARQADLTRLLTLPPLDGILAANALHFVRNQQAALHLIRQQLRPGGRLLIVEYEQALPIPWVPFPLPYQRFAALAHATGFGEIMYVGQRVSPSSGRVLYAASAVQVEPGTES